MENVKPQWDAERIAKARACAALLPDPAPEIVVEMLDCLLFAVRRVEELEANLEALRVAAGKQKRAKSRQAAIIAATEFILACDAAFGKDGW